MGVIEEGGEMSVVEVGVVAVIKVGVGVGVAVGVAVGVTLELAGGRGESDSVVGHVMPSSKPSREGAR